MSSAGVLAPHRPSPRPGACLYQRLFHMPTTRPPSSHVLRFWVMAYEGLGVALPCPGPEIQVWMKEAGAARPSLRPAQPLTCSTPRSQSGQPARSAEL